jgi:hypothetical protein
MWPVHSDVPFVSIKLYRSRILMVAHCLIRARCPNQGVISWKVSCLGGGKTLSKNGLEIREVTDGKNVIRRDTTIGN